MKRLLFILLCLLASPALADDAVTGLTWSSVTNTFQASMRALATKFVPDEQIVNQNAIPLTPNSGTCVSNTAYTVNWVKVGRLLTASGIAGCSSVSGTITTLNATIPNGWLCSGNGSGSVSDIWTGGVACKTTIGGNSLTIGFLNTSLGASSVTVAGGCFVNAQCYTSN